MRTAPISGARDRSWRRNIRWIGFARRGVVLEGRIDLGKIGRGHDQRPSGAMPGRRWQFGTPTAPAARAARIHPLSAQPSPEILDDARAAGATECNRMALRAFSGRARLATTRRRFAGRPAFGFARFSRLGTLRGRLEIARPFFSRNQLHSHSSPGLQGADGTGADDEPFVAADSRVS